MGYYSNDSGGIKPGGALDIFLCLLLLSVPVGLVFVVIDAHKDSVKADKAWAKCETVCAPHPLTDVLHGKKCICDKTKEIKE